MNIWVGLLQSLKPAIVDHNNQQGGKNEKDRLDFVGIYTFDWL
jgi:hypothetical protein